MAMADSTRQKLSTVLDVLNYVEVIFGGFFVVAIPAIVAYVRYHRELAPSPWVSHVRVATLLATFTWVAAALAGDDALVFMYRQTQGQDAPSGPQQDHVREAWCLAQKGVLLGLGEPAAVLLIAQLIQFGSSLDVSPEVAKHQLMLGVLRPLACITPIQLVLVFTERWYGRAAMFVTTSDVPTDACVVPTANVLICTVFSFAFLLYFNALCFQMRPVLISRKIKRRLFYLQLCHTSSLPAIVIIRIILLVGVGVTRPKEVGLDGSTEAFLSGALFSRFLLDVQFAVVFGAALLSVYSLVWRPLHEVNHITKAQRPAHVLEVHAIDVGHAGVRSAEEENSWETVGPAAGAVTSTRGPRCEESSVEVRKDARARSFRFASLLRHRQGPAPPPASASHSVKIKGGAGLSRERECTAVSGVSGATSNVSSNGKGEEAGVVASGGSRRPSSSPVRAATNLVEHLRAQCVPDAHCSCQRLNSTESANLAASDDDDDAGSAGETGPLTRASDRLPTPPMALPMSPTDDEAAPFFSEERQEGGGSKGQTAMELIQGIGGRRSPPALSHRSDSPISDSSPDPTRPRASGVTMRSRAGRR